MDEFEKTITNGNDHRFNNRLHARLLQETLISFSVLPSSSPDIKQDEIDIKFKVHITSNNFLFLIESPHPKLHMLPLLPRISSFLCRESYVNLAELAVIRTHDHNVRGMGLFSILPHKLLRIAIFKEILNCKAACYVKSRMAPCLSQLVRGSKLLVVLITLHILPGR